MATILLVENDPRERLLYTMELEGQGHKVLAAGRGEDALRMLEQVPVDLVVLDLVLPDGWGLDYLERMLSRNRDLKVIINTAYSGFRSNFRTWGAERFLTKASDLSELLTTVRELLSEGQENVEAN